MHMRADEFQLFKDNWEAQERLRAQKEKAQQPDKEKKKMNTPKNSRIYKKMSDVTAAAGSKDTLEHEKEGEVPVEYETWIQKLEQDVRKHIRIEQQLKLHVEQMQSQIDEAFRETVKQQ